MGEASQALTSDRQHCLKLFNLSTQLILVQQYTIFIAMLNSTICYHSHKELKMIMQLSEKLILLRALEGNLRGLNRPISKAEVARLMDEELGEAISQAYLSQLEAGKRPHMTEKSRELLARFFKVHPGYLVNDPEGFETALKSIPATEARIDDWIMQGANDFSSDRELAEALEALAVSQRTRESLLLAGWIAAHPDVAARLRSALVEVEVGKSTRRKTVKGQKQ